MAPSQSAGLPPHEFSGHATAFPYDAVLFDMDGVVTQTATVHATAWKELFDSVLADPRSGAGSDTPPFDSDRDYRLYVDGRSREDGIRAFLASRGMQLPEGLHGDSAEAWTVAGLAAWKNDLFLAALARDGVRAFPGTVALLERLREGGVPVALVTASRNAAALLADLGLESALKFDVIVDGQVAGESALPGKPDPAMFLEATHRLGVPPERAVVIEDAVSGVRAARLGGFGLVVGIDRAGHREQLEAAGADVVLGDVSQLDLGASQTDPWTLVYEGFDPAHEGHREALTALGNGYMVTRGARPERRDDGTHYPGTYLAGVYNRTVGIIQGRELEEEHLVNVPNWLPVDVRLGDGPWWSTGGIDVLEDRSELDLRRGVLTRRATLTGPGGERLEVAQRRLVSMHNPHLAALQTTLTAQGFNGAVSLRTVIDAQVANTNVRDYVGTGQVQLTDAVFSETDDNTVLCEVQTNQSQIRIALAVRTVFGGLVATPHDAENSNGRHLRQFDLQLVDGEPVTMTKTAALATSRDVAISSPARAALAELSRNADHFDVLLKDHQAAWRRLWDRFGIHELYNPRSARWMPDNSSRQRHVGLAVAYNAWQHFQTTGDRDWLAARGAELIFEVVRMFTSLADFDPSDGRYHIDGVMGPDEYHDGYPDAPGAGVRDNAYTNVLLSWVCDRAADVLQELAGHQADELIDRLQITPEEIGHWNRLGGRLTVPFHTDAIISQFEGYENLLELDWPGYRKKYGNIGRLDLILEAENDTTNRYKLSKQADVLMLIYLLGPAGVIGQLHRLGYPFVEAELGRTVEYYLSRTSEGSTLSRVVHASVLSRLGESRAWALFRQALVADLDDTQGGTTREGIHLGAMAGTVDIVIRSFAGLQTGANTLTFAPRLPAHLGTAEFRVQYRGHLIDVSFSAESLRIQLQPCSAPPVRIGVAGNYAQLAGGDEKDFALAQPRLQEPVHPEAAVEGSKASASTGPGVE